MALFKILKGAGNLPTTKTEGWAYVKKTGNDTADFYVDYDANTRVQIGKYAENGIYYIDGTGTTAGAWLGSHSGITSYYNGLSILYRPSVSGASTTTLNINGLGAKTCYVRGSTKLTTHYSIDSLIILTYDTSLNSGNGGWQAHTYYDSNTYCASLCTTGADTAAKTASHTNYILRDGNWTLLTVRYSNTYQGKLTLNINNSGAKDLWINGAVSSSSNYTLPAGTYLVYYDGTKYLLYTNNYIPAHVAETDHAITADSATKAEAFSSAATVKLTGDVTGEASSTKGWTVATTLGNTTVAAGTYGPTANAQPKHGGTFSVPSFVVNSQGRLTGAYSKTITLPTYNVFGGASASNAGSTGLVPAPTKGQEGYYLRGDGKWFNLTEMDSTVQNNFQALKDAWVSADTSLKNTLTTLINGKAPTNHASNNTTYGISTNTLYGHAMASSTTPKASAATAAVGSETAKFARGDHVHPLTVANSWTGGQTAGPKIITTINGVSGTGVSIPTATASASGAVIVGDQTFGGIKRFSQTDVHTTYYLGSFYNYTSGYLIDIGPAQASTMVVIHITGNSYTGSDVPINSLYQVYDYSSGTTMNYSGISIGQDLGAMKVYRYNNRLYAHIAQKNTYSTFNITLYTNKAGLTPTVTNAAAPTGGYTDLITITPSRPPLANSGVAAGSYGPSANASPAHGGTFSVPYITFDSKGRATAASTKTITLPIYTIGNATITIKAGTGLKTGGSFTTNQTSAGTITLDHSNSITAGSVGSAQSPSHGGTFAIPKITYDAQGHITNATTVNITLPADNNTDTKVTQTVTTSNAAYPLLLAPNGQTATTTTTSYFDSGVTLNPSTNTIAANISGNAATATTALTVGQGNDPNTAFDANDIIVPRSKKTFYSTNTDKMSNRPNGSSWGYLDAGSYDNAGTYMYQTFINGANANMYVRVKNSTWGNWHTLLDSSNYTNYTVTKTGSGASGTWNININGTAKAIRVLSSNPTSPVVGEIWVTT